MKRLAQPADLGKAITTLNKEAFQMARQMGEVQLAICLGE